MSIYDKAIKELVDAGEKYKRKTLSLDSYKAKVWQAASEIVAIEEDELREFLKQAEAELDSIQFTADDDSIFPETIKIVEKINDRITNA